MGEVWFYHLTETPVEAALPRLLAQALAAGWRIEVRGTDPARMDLLDRALWLGPEDGFLPHGLAGGPHDALQPVLLTVAPARAEGCACLIALDGAGITAAEAAGRARTCILFDGADAAALNRAREQWRALTAAGLAAKYWAQEGGRWVMRQERSAAGPAAG
jgi:DNA polymerase-3 subunit chi